MRRKKKTPHMIESKKKIIKLEEEFLSIFLLFLCFIFTVRMIIMPKTLFSKEIIFSQFN